MPSEVFSKVAHWTAKQCGRASTFVLACATIVVWAVSGPVFHFSDTWQLVINTGTTIVTFLMVFLLQHAQNRDSTAIQLKLDELIRASRGARNKLLTIEDLTEAELDHLKEAFAALAKAGDGANLRKTREGLRQAEDGLRKAKESAEKAKKEAVD